MTTAITAVEWRSARFPGLTLWVCVDEDGHSRGAGGTLAAAVAWIVRRLDEGQEAPTEC